MLLITQQLSSVLTLTKHKYEKEQC